MTVGIELAISMERFHLDEGVLARGGEDRATDLLVECGNTGLWMRDHKVK